jgi:hypothetical protein
LNILVVSIEFRDTPYDYERALADAGVGPCDGLAGGAIIAATTPSRTARRVGWALIR